MAITSEQVLSTISQYRLENGRPCPAKYLVSQFGDEVLDIVKTLKDNGTLIGKRGRTGGLLPADAAASPAPETTESENESSESSVEDQFAALAAKLASAEEASEAVAF